jgi:hypothetical protein
MSSIWLKPGHFARWPLPDRAQGPAPLRGVRRQDPRAVRPWLSTRDIDAHLDESYGVKVGRDLISRVTDAVVDDVRAWQQRPLNDVHPVLFLDALVLKIREGGNVQRRAGYLRSGHGRGRA